MPQSQLKYHISVIYPPELQGQHTLGETPLIIGRSKEADLSFDDEWISRNHCKIWVDEDTIWAEDLDSTNGTYLDGQMITRQNVHLNSKIQLGKIVLKVECEDPTPAKTLPFPGASQAISTVDEVEENGEEYPDFSSESLESTYEEMEEIEEKEDESDSEYISAEIVTHTKEWIANQDLDILEYSFFLISTREFESYLAEEKEEACQFINLELHEILYGEKISDELLFQLSPGNFAFVVPGMNREQTQFFATEIIQIIEKQIFNYLGENLQVSPVIGCAFVQRTTGPIDVVSLFNNAHSALESAKENGEAFSFA